MKSRQTRRLSVEPLENRELLSASPLFLDDFPNAGDWSRGAPIAISETTGEGSVRGVLEQRTDTDLLRFTAAASGQAVIRLDTPTSNLDPYLYVYDGSSSHRQLAFNDDWNGLDSQVTLPVTAGQTYFLLADNYRDGSTGAYVLSVRSPVPVRDDAANGGRWSEATPVAVDAATGDGSLQGVIEQLTDTDLFRFTAPVSGQAVIRLDTPSSDLDPYLSVYAGTERHELLASNDDSNGVDSQVTITVATGQTYYVLADNYRDGSTGPYTLSVRLPIPAADDFANGGRWTEATWIALDALTGDGSIQGVIEQPTDTDLFRFTAPATGRTVLRLDTPASNLDPYLYVYSWTEQHGLLASNDDYNGLDSQVAITAVAGQTYFLLADNYADRSTGSYRLSVDAPASDTTPPTVTSRSPDAVALSTDAAAVDIVFSEAVRGLDAADLVLTGAGAAGATVGPPIDLGNNTWRLPISGLGDGEVEVALASDANDVEDLTGNDLAPVRWNFRINRPPTVTLRSPDGALVRGPDLTVDVTFSEPVVGVDATDLAVSGPGAATATVWSAWPEGNVWRFQVYGLQDGSVNVVLVPQPGAIQDADGLDLAPTAWSFTVDATPPRVITQSPLDVVHIASSTMHLDVTFSEPVRGLRASSLLLAPTSAVAGATVGEPVDLGSNTWRFTIVDLTEGTVIAQLVFDGIHDEAGHALTWFGHVMWMFTVDGGQGGSSAA